MKFKSLKRLGSRHSHDTMTTNGTSNGSTSIVEEGAITEEQQVMIEDLRKDVRSMLDAEYDTDFNLLRWLKAYQFDVPNVRKRLLRHLQMRRLLDMNRVDNLDFSDWEIHEKYIPIGYLGPAGKDNRFVIIECAGRGDPAGLMECVQPTRFMLSRFKLLNKALKDMNEAERETQRQSGLIYIYDLECLEMDPTLLPIVVGPLRILWQHVSNHCPEMIDRLIVVHPPNFMNMLWLALAPFLPDHTKKKVVFTTATNMTEVLKEYIDPAHLPVHWGGELVDSKGDPMCRERIVIPEGKIPKHLYWKPLPGEPTQDQLALCSVSAGSKVYKSFTTSADNIILHWHLQCSQEFTVAAFYDPSNSNSSTPEEKEKHEEYLAHMEQPGTHVIDHHRWPLFKAGTYHFKMGNEKAWIKSVHVYYKMEFAYEDGSPAENDIMFV